MDRFEIHVVFILRCIIFPWMYYIYDSEKTFLFKTFQRKSSIVNIYFPHAYVKFLLLILLQENCHYINILEKK